MNRWFRTTRTVDATRPNQPRVTPNARLGIFRWQCCNSILDPDIDSDHDDQHPEHDNKRNYYLFFLISILALYQLSSNVSGNHRPVECHSNGTAGHRPGRFKLEGTLRVLMELLNMSCILSLPLPLLPSAHER